MTTQMVIVEDDPRYSDTLELLFTHQEAFDVRGIFPSGEDCLAAARTPEAAGWGLALMDIELGGISGLETTRQLKAVLPETKVVVLTAFEDSPRILEAICAGADGYLLKDAGHQEIVDHARAAVLGQSPMTKGVATTVLKLLRQRGPKKPIVPIALSPREHDVLRALVDGHSYKQVAGELGVALETVRSYIKTLYKKLQVHSVAEAVSLALRQGLV